MRGRDVAARMGEHFADWHNVPQGPLDTVVCVKYWDPVIREIRKRCKRLIVDGLDCWSQTHPMWQPADFWQWVQTQTQCDLMLGCSPSAVESMQAAGCAAVCAPHHADERIGTDWYDADGPIVYAGGERFLGDERPRIEAACKALGREFVCRFDKDCWQALKGAALSLCVRFGKERTPLALIAKPTVKIANAARGRIPTLATMDSAITSLHPPGSSALFDGGWDNSIANGLACLPPIYPWTLDTHCTLIRKLAG